MPSNGSHQACWLSVFSFSHPLCRLVLHWLPWTKETPVHLSVIIPTLNRQETAALVAERICGLLHTLDVEVIVVTPAGQRATAPIAKVRYVADAGHGVYAAYRAGLHSASGEYVWFIGDDDYPLDAAADLIPFLQNGAVDMLVAPVLLSSGRLYRPTKSLLLLLYFNWCQQGVVYRRQTLLRRRFFRRLMIQADQYINVLLRADKAVSVKFLKRPICVFGVNGISGRMQDAAYDALRTVLAHRALGCVGFLAYRVLESFRQLVRRMR
jgi:glycosyltransferase involved in cell wall biosynthesis